ncbi:MAG TPA: ABC transporter permease [Vicinamibacterales bacterium]|nr:ABC transporter permease [Vicinamibacterales bacterium]
MIAVYTLWWRDVVRFLRQRSRIVGALGSPIVFWALIGSGMHRSFRPPGAAEASSYLEFFFPGTLALIVLFTAIFSTISVIEDRQAGFMQGVLVAPVPRSAIVLGKVLGGTTLSLLQAALFLLLAPLVGIRISWPAVIELVAVLALLGFALTALGFLLAWWLNTTQGFHAVMNLLLVPMWILSGALFPADGAAPWVRALMLANPLTYGVTSLRLLLTPELTATGPSLATSVAVVTGFGVALLAADAAVVGRRA